MSDTDKTGILLTTDMDETDNEDERLARLDALNIVFSPAEERFDRITRVAKAIFRVPIALVSLVTRDQQWFKSKTSCIMDSSSREISFCTHTIKYDAPFIIPNALEDERFAENPLVIGPPYIRFYAGVPIRYQDMNIGTFCIIDIRPRELNDTELETLRTMASWVESELSVWMLSSGQGLVLTSLDEKNRAELLDPLTTCWNRAGLTMVLEKELGTNPEQQLSITALYIVIENYKQLEQDYKADLCKLLILEFSQRLRSVYPQHTIVTRLEEDCFVLLHTEASIELINECTQTLANWAAQTIEQTESFIPVTFSLTTCFGFMSHHDQVDHVITRCQRQRQQGYKRQEIRCMFNP